MSFDYGDICHYCGETRDYDDSNTDWLAVRFVTGESWELCGVKCLSLYIMDLGLFDNA